MMDDLRDLLITLASDHRAAISRAARRALYVDLDALAPLSDLMAGDLRYGERFKSAVMQAFNEADEAELLEEASRAVKQTRRELREEKRKRFLSYVRARRDGETEEERLARLKRFGIDD